MVVPVRTNTWLLLLWLGFIALFVATDNDVLLGLALAGLILNVLVWLRVL